MDSLIRFFFHHADYYSTISDTINGGIYAIVALIVIAIIIRIVTILIARSCYVIETENNTGIFVVSTIIACIYSTFEYLTIVYITSFFSMGWFIALNIFYLLLWSLGTGVKAKYSADTLSKLSYLTHAVFTYSFNKINYLIFIQKETELTKAQLKPIK